jgi:hypothetical protein
VRAQRLAAATAAVGLVSVCCAASISAGSAATSTDSATAVSDPGNSQVTITRNQDGSNTTARKIKTDDTSSSTTGLARSSNLRVREAFSRSTSDKPSSSTVRVGTFNVRTARAHDGRSWLQRANDVAREIASSSPGVLAVQELGPGRADGSKGTTRGTCGRRSAWSAR